MNYSTRFTFNKLLDTYFPYSSILDFWKQKFRDTTERPNRE